MTRMRFERAALLLMTAALTPLLMGAGGGAPPPFDSKVVGITYTFSAVMDPHAEVSHRASSAHDRTAAPRRVRAAHFRSCSGTSPSARPGRDQRS